MWNKKHLWVMLLFFATIGCAGPNERQSPRRERGGQPAFVPAEKPSPYDFDIKAGFFRLEMISPVSSRTVLMRLEIRPQRKDLWLEPGDVFLFRYMDYSRHEKSSGTLYIFTEDGKKLAFADIEEMSGGLLIARVCRPYSFEAMEAHQLNVVMDTTMFSPRQSLFLELIEFRRAYHENRQKVIECGIKVKVHFH